MYIRQFFDYLDRTKHYEFYFSLKNIAFAKHKDNLPKHLNSKDLKSFIYTLINYRTRSSYEKRNKCILLLIILGGLRKSEVFNLELRSIVLEKEHYILLIKGKNNKERKALLFFILFFILIIFIVLFVDKLFYLQVKIIIL